MKEASSSNCTNLSTSKFSPSLVLVSSNWGLDLDVMIVVRESMPGYGGDRWSFVDFTSAFAPRYCGKRIFRNMWKSLLFDNHEYAYDPLSWHCLLLLWLKIILLKVLIFILVHSWVVDTWNASWCLCYCAIFVNICSYLNVLDNNIWRQTLLTFLHLCTTTTTAAVLIADIESIDRINLDTACYQQTR